MVIRLVGLLCLLFRVAIPNIQAQGVSPLQKTWTLVRTRSINGNSIVRNPLYSIRFDEMNMYYAMQQGAHESAQPYTLANNQIKAKFTSFTIESLTDSSLTLRSSAEQNMYFIAKGRSPCGDSLLEKVGDFNGHPYYKAMPYLMPAKIGEPLFTTIENALNIENRTAKISFKISFIVDIDGSVANATMLESYSAKVDAIVLGQIQKSSGKWKAPMGCGVPVATLVTYVFQFDPPMN